MGRAAGWSRGSSHLETIPSARYIICCALYMSPRVPLLQHGAPRPLGALRHSRAHEESAVSHVPRERRQTSGRVGARTTQRSHWPSFARRGHADRTPASLRRVDRLVVSPSGALMFPAHPQSLRPTRLARPSEPCRASPPLPPPHLDQRREGVVTAGASVPRFLCVRVYSRLSMCFVTLALPHSTKPPSRVPSAPRPEHRTHHARTHARGRVEKQASGRC